MKDQKKLMFGIAVAAIVIIGGVIAAGGMKKDSTSTASTSSTSSAKTSTSSSDTSSAVATTAVKIENYMFGPMITKVKVGDTVTWTNMDAVHHNVVADQKSADGPNGPLIGKGETYSFKFAKAGTYTFHCEPHPYMHGTVIVE
jgi:amicyanin